jgi:hypothetical protein
MHKSLARLLAGWLLMLAGAGLMLESGLVDLRTTNRTRQAVQAVTGLVLAAGGVWLRRHALKQTQT